MLWWHRGQGSPWRGEPGPPGQKANGEAIAHAPSPPLHRGLSGTIPGGEVWFCCKVSATVKENRPGHCSTAASCFFFFFVLSGRLHRGDSTSPGGGAHLRGQKPVPRVSQDSGRIFTLLLGKLLNVRGMVYNPAPDPGRFLRGVVSAGQRAVPAVLSHARHRLLLPLLPHPFVVSMFFPRAPGAGSWGVLPEGEFVSCGRRLCHGESVVCADAVIAAPLCWWVGTRRQATWGSGGRSWRFVSRRLCHGIQSLRCCVSAAQGTFVRDQACDPGCPGGGARFLHAGCVSGESLCDACAAVLPLPPSPPLPPPPLLAARRSPLPPAAAGSHDRLTSSSKPVRRSSSSSSISSSSSSSSILLPQHQ
jgi:hypothetical protein